MSYESGRGSPIPPGFAKGSGGTTTSKSRANKPTPPAVPISEISGRGASSDERSQRPKSPALQPVPFHPYNDFTNLGPQYPATDLILHLIKLVSADVCSFKCNAFTAYLLLSDAGAICRNINKLIQNLDNSGDDKISWDDFTKFTAAITPLEECAACFSSTS